MFERDLMNNKGSAFCCNLLILALSFSEVKSRADYFDDDYLGYKITDLKADVVNYHQALEKFDKSNNSFDALSGSLRYFFRYVDLTRPDELTSFIFSYSKLRPDLFPLVQERRSANEGHAQLKSNLLIKRKDGTFFLIYPNRPSIDFLSARLKQDEDGLWAYDGVNEPIKNWVLVTMYWRKKYPHEYFRNVTVDFRWDKLDDDTNFATRVQAFDRPKFE
nr:PREDICTED: uncharacterized protein LOC109030706 isoform X1 [Bemisia tabaci]